MTEHYKAHFCTEHGYAWKQRLRGVIYQQRGEYIQTPEIKLVNATEPKECAHTMDCEEKARVVLLVVDGVRVDGAEIEVKIS